MTSIFRLWLVGIAFLLTGCAATPPRTARVLHWTGEATVFAGERRIELGVDTTVEPFLRARSDTWLRDPGRASLRTLEIDGRAGWTTRDGKREAMPVAMAEHERLQYATYGLMLAAPTQHAAGTIQLNDPRAAPATLTYDDTGRLVALDNVVPDPEGTGTVRQHFTFEGVVESHGVRWPRVIRIAQDDVPFFELRIAMFEAH
jgi:hypothetical protein